MALSGLLACDASAPRGTPRRAAPPAPTARTVAPPTAPSRTPPADVPLGSPVGLLARLPALLGRLGEATLAPLPHALVARCRLGAWRHSRPVGLSVTRRWLRGRVVLTFDDGPLRQNTGRLLDVLKKHRAPATFFVVAKMINLVTYPLIRRILREGHTLANHSYHHLVDMLKHERAGVLVPAELQLAQALVDLALLARDAKDFERLRRRLLLGHKDYVFDAHLPERWPAMARAWRRILRARAPGGVSPHRMIYVRPPGGSPYGGRFAPEHKRHYARILARLGLINVLWDEETRESDPRLPPAKRRDPKIQATALVEGARKGGILLAHDRIRPEALDDALTQLANGTPRVTVVTLDSLTRRRFGCAPEDVARALRGVHRLSRPGSRPPQ